MAKPDHIELPTGEQAAILYEDRSVLAIGQRRGNEAQSPSRSETRNGLV